ncbi:MAG: ABC transporter ATP-binding protein [Alphaproteobacteria bacterium]
MALLEVNGIHVYYGAIRALHGISFTVDEGQIITLIGANGAGKTTTLNAISGILGLQQGKITVFGEDIAAYMPHQLVPKGVTHVPEGRRIFGRLTVDENLGMGAFTREDKNGIAHDRERVLELFPRLRERLKQVAGTLSGGEQQMLAIGRGLMSNPKLLLLDEPSMGLAPILVDQVFESIKDINKQGVTILLVEQNAFVALKVASYGYVLESGEIRTKGPADELIRTDEIKRAYLG